MVKNPPAKAGEADSIPVWDPCVFVPGESHGQRSLVGCSPWGHKESDMTWPINNNNRDVGEKGSVSCPLRARHCWVPFPQGSSKCPARLATLEHAVLPEPLGPSNWLGEGHRCREELPRSGKRRGLWGGFLGC